MMKNLALIVAAGSGKRFGGDVPKQYYLLNGKTVLQHSIEAFLNHPEIDAVRVVISKDDEHYSKLSINNKKLLSPIIGGAERQDSVKIGLESVNDLEPKNVLIHDAARPFVSVKIINECLAALNTHEAVVPVIAVNESARYQGKSILRSELKLVQTPQAFNFQTVLKAHQSKLSATDDAQLVEAMGVKIHMIEGDVKNIKITTKDDLKIVPQIRVGSGFDVHQFEEGDGVIICGIKVPHDKKLKGHSDADVGIHSIVDALLGAIGEGDIGEHFPPSEAKWKNADSVKFLQHARELVKAKSAIINNIDVTIICEEPKLSTYKQQMRQKIAEIVMIDISAVNIKATTTEKLGFTGRKEGIAAQAIASVTILG